MDRNRRSSVAGFEGKSFYFDLENCPQIGRQLTKYINELGGEIKGFLDQRIKYIITNRPKDQWPPKVDTTSNSRHSLPTNPVLDQIKDQLIQSPINLNKNSSFSRGKLLLSAIAKSQQTISKPSLPTDVLERGRYWNITILQAVDVLAFCRRHLSPVVNDNQTVSPSQIKRLKGAYIKLEDNRLQHRPAYKEFPEWPQINFESTSIMCPFLKKKVQKESPTKQPIESLEGLAVKNRLNGKLMKANPKNTTTNDNNNKNKKSSPNGVLIKKNLVKKRRIPAFCEICGSDYDDLIEHLKSETHETYTNNEDNYKGLKGVIQSLHPFNETQNSIKRIQFDARSDDSCDEDNVEEDQPISSPLFQSTPNMSTIQLCGPKHKFNFLSIHDLIGNKSPLPTVSPEDQEVPKEDQREGQSSKTDIVFIPPSVSSPDEKTVKRMNQILDSSSEDVLNTGTELNCISDEL